MKNIDPKLIEAFKAAYKASASVGDPATRYKALNFIAKAVEIPLRQGVMSGENGVREIFRRVPFSYGRSYEYPIDLLAPGTENDFTAWVIPREGDMPTNQVEGDYVSIPTYEYGNAISWRNRYAEDSDIDVMARCMEIIEAGVVKKQNDDGWHVVLAAAFDRNIVVFDSQASQGEFTKRAVSLAKVTMRRNAGGNASSIQPRALTDIHLSPEMIEEMRNWNADQVDEITRREIYVAGDGGSTLSRVFGVTLHDTFEFGEGQEYQTFWTDLGASLASGDVELMIGINNRSNGFVNPVRKEFSVVPDERLNTFRLSGLMGIGENGWASLDGRDCLAISC